MTDWRDRIQDILNTAARSGGTVTYRQIAERADIPSPGRIQTVTNTLEGYIRSDHAAGQPLRAAVAISKARDGLPAPGFFQLCREIGLYFGPDHGPQAALFHAMELRRLHDAMRH
jgi:hypothetical protein